MVVAVSRRKNTPIHESFLILSGFHQQSSEPVCFLFIQALSIYIESVGSFSDEVNKVQGWLSRQEGWFLYRLAKRCHSQNGIVEIGSWKGKSTLYLAQGSQDGKKAKVYSIDPHTGSTELKLFYKNINTFAEFISNIKNQKLENLVVPIREKSENSIDSVPVPIELLFIDGAHDYHSVLQDYKIWFPKLISGGMLVFHDSFFFPGVHLVTAFILLTSKQVKSPRLIDTSLILTKVECNSKVDRAKNIFYIFYKIIMGPIGLINILIDLFHDKNLREI